eukprot:TRINITY_DN1348_c0_g1_i1.p1 TRINITY_DN1348_c0_g1~~TRINITY_DN1348_c0_g1_i1.p1  ORF type:complete len:976 (-),score=373.50 TRINITY_DN1348_c0_g1_i1:78-3005(-)
MGTRDPFKVGGGKKDKKIRKGRLDKYYYLAKEQGFRSRAAFKLIQLNKKYDVFKTAKIVLDLCAAPGGWLQVARKAMPASGILIGVDLAAIKPLHNVITLVEDITTASCKAAIKSHINDYKVDVVLHDGSPNMGQAWAQDAFTQAELVLKSLELASYFLHPGGVFISKVFRSADYNALLYVFNQLFAKVEVTKPPASRNTSAEIYVICSNFLSLNKIDPKLFNPKYTFQELDVGGTNVAGSITRKQQDVFNSTQKRFRQGYDESNPTLYKSLPVLEFIRSVDPIDLLSHYNKFEFIVSNVEGQNLRKKKRVAKEEVEKEVSEAEEQNIRKVQRNEATTDEIKRCLDDLRLLGKRDFKDLLKWRLEIRKSFPEILDSGKTRKDGEEEGEEGVKKEGQEDEDEEDEDEESEDSGAEELEVRELRRKEKKRKEKKKRKALKKRAEASVGLDVADEIDKTEPLFDLRDASYKLMPKNAQSLVEMTNDIVDEDTKPVKQPKGKKGDKERRLNKIADEETKQRKLEGLADENYDDVVDEMLDGMYQSYLQRREDRSSKLRRLFGKDKGIGMGWEEDMHQQLPDETDTNNEEESEEEEDKLVVKGEQFTRPGKKGKDAEEKNMNLWFSNNLFKETDDMDIDDEDQKGANMDSDEDEEDKVQEVIPSKPVKSEGKKQNGAKTSVANGGGISKGVAGTFDHKKNKKVVEEAPKTNKKRKRKDEYKEDEPEFYEVVPMQKFGNEDESSDEDETTADINMAPPNKRQKTGKNKKGKKSQQEEAEEDDDDDEEEWEPEESLQDRAVTLAIGKAITLSKERKREFEDDGYNKYAFNDREFAPQWFVDDELKHQIPFIPVTKEDIMEMREKEMLINARPIKKVAEAKARKKRRAVRRTEKIREKASSIAKEGDMSDIEKIRSIQKLYKNVGKGDKNVSVYIVRNKWESKGSKAGKGVKAQKGKNIKLVDPRQKKDKRGKGDRTGAKKKK